MKLRQLLEFDLKLALYCAVLTEVNAPSIYRHHAGGGAGRARAPHFCGKNNTISKIHF